MSVALHYQQICEKISQVTSEPIKVIGVSKFQPLDKLEEAYRAGIFCLGENRVQEGAKKKPALPQEIEWHLIGHLQKNKVRQALQVFDWIHSVDSLQLGILIDEEAKKQNKRPTVLLQVNIAEEPQKYGVSLDEAKECALELAQLSHIKFAGLMVMAPFTEVIEETRPIFREGSRLFKEIQQEIGSSFQYLSMGMTNDYLVAIEEGANIVRIGRALFSEEK